MTLGATDQGMVAGDLVNTAARLQSVAAAGHRAGRRGDPARRRRRRSRSSRPASRCSRARRRPVPAWRALRVVAERGGRGRARGARGAVRRPRRRAAPAQGPVPRHRPRAAAAARLGHRAGRHRQEPPRLGVREVRRRARRGRSGGTTAARRPTARASPSGRWARWSARGLRPAGDRRRADDAREGRRRRVARATSPTRPSDAGSSRRCWRCWASSGQPAVASELFGAWRTFFERIAAQRPGGDGVRGPPLGGHGPARLHRPPARVDARPARSTSSRWPGRSCSSADRTGAPASATSRRIYLEPLPTPAMRELLAGLVPGLPDSRGRADRRRAPTGSRCTRSRPCGCCSPRAGSPVEGGVYRPVGDLTDLAVPETLTALIAARLDALDAGRPGLLRTRPSSARASRSPASRPSSGSPTAGARAAPARARPARAADARGRPALAGARPVRLRPGAHPRGRLQHARAARPQAPPPRRRPLLRVARRRRARRRARRPLPRGPRATRPRAPRPSPRGQARIALRGAAERAAALGSHDQALGVPRAGARRSTTDPRSGRDLWSERASPRC